MQRILITHLKPKQSFMKNVRLFILLLGLLIVSHHTLFAQTKIKDNSISGSSNIPHAAAVVEFESKNKGVLLPRVALKATNIAAPVSALVAGMIVYNTATAGTAPNKVTPGYYYCDGTKWLRLVDTQTSADRTSDGWKDDKAKAQVVLAYQSNGVTARTPGTEVVVKDNGRIGIGTATPQANLDVRTKNPSNPSKNAGIAVPQVSKLPASGNRAGQIVYLTLTNKYFYFDGTNWQCLNCLISYGDIKQSFHTTDHDGWVLLDGRALTSLNADQQSQATRLGFTDNLPNGNEKVLKKKGAVGTTGGANTVNIAQANLPAVNFTGATNVAGNHHHSFGDRGSASLAVRNGTGSSRDVARDSELSNLTKNSGEHAHKVTVHSGGSGTPLSVEDEYLSVNIFIYLGS